MERKPWEMPVDTDPVCGMNVERGREAGRSEYRGETYRFCSPTCQDQFERSPDRYAGRSSPR